ncbi:MAG: hypothetical protein DRI26_00135 [Chloroflexi bacterium]|nr:MAG: hypothetical protein DRI26_00135 [Chloroflexota bacterium]
MGKITEWTTIKVPVKLANEVKRLAKERNIPPHKLLAEAIVAFKAKEYEFDRRIWYIMKLLMGYMNFRLTIMHKGNEDDVIEEAIVNFDYPLEQIQERLKAINREEREQIINMAKEWAKTLDGKKLARLTSAVKDVVFKVLAYA